MHNTHIYLQSGSGCGSSGGGSRWFRRGCGRSGTWSPFNRQPDVNRFHFHPNVVAHHTYVSATVALSITSSRSIPWINWKLIY